MIRSSYMRGFLFLVVASVVSAVHAQQGKIPTPVFQGPPGARALGIGGAFIGVADDATAAEANPGGLTILSRPELSLHVRSHNIELGSDDDSAIRPSFISYAAPAGPLVWSIYYTSAIDFNTRSIQTNVFEPGDRIEFGGKFSIKRLGAAAAFRPLPLLSIGGAVGVTRLDVDTASNFSGPFTFEGIPYQIEDAVRSQSDETGLNFNLGALINPGGRFSAGVVYKREASLKGTQTERFRFCARCTSADLQRQAFDESTGNVDIPIPDFYGAGIAFRPFARGLIAADYGVQSTTISADEGGSRDIKANTYRVGAEYLIALPGGRFFVPLRVGYAKEKDKDYDISPNIAQDANTTTFGTGVVFGNTELAAALSTGETITTGDKIRQVIFSVIRRF